jgi:hypothetical protein
MSEHKAEPSKTEEREVQIISKLSVATVNAKPTTIGVPEHGQVRLARFGGIARDLIVKENKATGDFSEGLAGDFIGINLKTGQEFRSGILYLPSGIQEAIASELRDKTVQHEIEFFVELRAQKAANPIGYSYVAVPVYKPEAVDPLAKFRQFMVTTSDTKALPAPAKV